VSIADLGSHNGTRVNGERIGGVRSLGPGDIVTIGEALLVLYGDGGSAAARRLLDASQLRQRLDEEIERAAAYDRPLGLVTLSPGSAPWDRAAVLEALDGALRRIDLVGQSGDNLLVWLAPELDKEALRAEAEGVLATLAPLVPEVRAGLSCCPGDGTQAGALLAAARSAAGLAPVGGVEESARAATAMAVGERTILVADPAMLRLYELIRRLAQTDLAVLITGETGTGKENASYALHKWSARAARPIVTLNCAALQDTLVESELFGYEKGAFSGAAAAKPGLLEVADGGTVFLDEVGELSPALQAKLLRALEVKRFTRVGGLKERDVDIRIVAATNRSLEDEIKAGRFRQDLFFRLSGATVMLPPLRERPREVAALARAFLAAAGRPRAELATATLHVLGRYAWPGNVRELKNAMEYAAATAGDGAVEPWHLPERIGGEGADEPEAAAGPRFRDIGDELRELESRRMQEALDAAGGVQRRAARLIGMPLRTFVMKLKQYGLRKT
jgi:DNA-binding NtrC family response regulator